MAIRKNKKNDPVQLPEVTSDFPGLPGFSDKGDPFNEDAYANRQLVGGNTQELLWLLQQSNQNASNADSEKDSFNTLVQYLQELESRSYNENQANKTREYDRALQLDERAYTSEAAQLSRLMSLGLSRSAALQMIQGGSVGTNAATAQQSQGGASGVSSTISPSQTAANIANTVYSGINSLAQLVQLGLNAPNIIASGQLNSALAYNAQQGAQGLGLASQYLGNVQSALDSGLINYNDVQDIQALREKMLGITAEQDPNIYAYMHNGGYDAFRRSYNAMAYARGAFTDDWNARGYKQTPEDAEAYRHNLYAMVAAQELQLDKIKSEIDLNGAQMSESFARASEIASQTAINEQELRLYPMKSSLMASEILKNVAVARDTETHQKMSAIALHRAELTADTLDQIALYDVARDLTYAQASNDPKVKQNVVNSIINDAAKTNALMEFNYLYYNQAVELAKSEGGKQMLNLGVMMHDMNLEKLILESYTKNKSVSNDLFGGHSSQTESSHSFDNVKELLYSFGIDVDYQNDYKPFGYRFKH